jgi:hypothetical protein
MTTPTDAERLAFEAALKKNPDALFWNTSDALFWAWQAARALPVDGLDAEVCKSCGDSGQITSTDGAGPYECYRCSDGQLIDFLDNMPGHKWIARQSGLGRGYRVHQDKDGTHDTARQAIRAAIALKQQEPS